jgi:hypothetical protein
MKTQIPVSEIVAYGPSAPIVSAQKKSVMSMGMDRQISQMQENMKEMQQQMG